ncbi:MAG: ribosomal protein S18-alanine N-acetyltransferase [Oscillospiraceae bacterium]|jgi:ribosomal-protein-alanine N-acetyltransferase|nr:ribosomal protein S18-alanine N-acetyltransferase [Oscillospiraceae bacterium]
MNFELQKMNELHLNRVHEIEDESFISEKWSAMGFKTELKNTNSNCMVAVECDLNLVVGYVIFQHVLDEGYIPKIAVQRKYRNLGVGKFLLGAVLNVANELSLKYINLEVRQSNFSAITMYLKCGFNIVGIRKNFYSGPCEYAVLMNCVLAKIEVN